MIESLIVFVRYVCDGFLVCFRERHSEAIHSLFKSSSAGMLSGRLLNLLFNFRALHQNCFNFILLSKSEKLLFFPSTCFAVILTLNCKDFSTMSLIKTMQFLHFEVLELSIYTTLMLSQKSVILLF